jgi:hypothetical protein
MVVVFSNLISILDFSYSYPVWFLKMKRVFLGFLVSLTLTSITDSSLAEEYPLFPRESLKLAVDRDELFYTIASQLVQQQINLVARFEQALHDPDPNPMRIVRGQLTNQAIAVDNFLMRRYSSPKTLCTNDGNFSQQSPLPVQLDESKAKIYCSLHTANQNLLKLRPVIDRLLSRRGELALVRELPLVSGERQLDPVLTIAPVQRPDLGQPSTPFLGREPNLTTSSFPVVGRTAKTAIANYVPPLQPAITPPEDALTILKTANQILTTVQAAFPSETRFINPQETNTTLDQYAYDIDSHERQVHAQFLELPRTGIFRVLPDSVYRRQPNTLENRLTASVGVRYPFPSVGKSEGELNPSLALVIVGDRFQLVNSGVNYGFLTNVGDLPLEKLDQQMVGVSPQMREFFFNYQPPKQLEALQVDRRRFITGKNQNWNQEQIMLASTPVELNHTYLVRSLQFQLPEIILRRQPVYRQNSRARQQLGLVPSSDTIIAFRPVRRRLDGSYTILWRVIHSLPAPQIEDLEKYVQ